jgi:hypothetical protein
MGSWNKRHRLIDRFPYTFNDTRSPATLVQTEKPGALGSGLSATHSQDNLTVAIKSLAAALFRESAYMVLSGRGTTTKMPGATPRRWSG